jgi:AraC-like DNA-binding protein
VSEDPPLIYVERAPTGALEGVVERAWFLRRPSPERFEKILPLPFVHLIVNLSEPYRVVEQGGDARDWTTPPVFASGIQTSYLVNENPLTLHHVGVALTPLGLEALGGDPRLAADRVLDAEELLPGITGLRGVIQEIGDPDAAIDRLEAFLVERLVPGWRPDPRVLAAIAILARRPDRPIGGVAEELGVGHKTLIALFVRHCGVTPKRLAEVYRHVTFVNAIPDEPPLPTWAELAASAGYYDQPHFIRSFARLTGLTPRHYLEQKRSAYGAASFLPLTRAD